MVEEEINNEQEQIRLQLWRLFDILRSETITLGNYYITLLLMTLYNEGILKDLPSHSDRTFLTQLIRQRVAETLIGDSFVLLTVFNHFENTFNHISQKSLQDSISLLNGIDHEIFRKNFAFLFDIMLYRIAESEGKKGGEFLQPIELTKLLIELADLPNNAKVFNPYAGVASFGSILNDEMTYIGQELNQTIWALGVLRLMAYRKKSFKTFEQADSVNNWPEKEGYFDLVIAHPPFNLTLKNSQNSDFSPVRKVDEHFIKRGLKSINKNGKLIGVFPLGLLYRSGNELVMRKDIIDRDLLETVIYFPGGLLLNTGMPFCVLLINNNKRVRGTVKLIDAGKFILPADKGKKRIISEVLFNELRNGGEESSSIRDVLNDEIHHNNYNLNVPRYFQKNYQGIELGNVLEPIKGEKSKIKFGKVVRLGDLKDDALDFLLQLHEIRTGNVEGSMYREINESVLLLALRWRTLKPTYFKYEGEAIFISGNIQAFKINNSLVDIQYLVNELHAHYVEEQVDSFRIGATIPFITKRDLSNIKISLPPLREQQAKAAGLVELAERLRLLQNERNFLAHGQSISNYNEYASLKHTLGRPRQNILDWSVNLLDFLKNDTSCIEEMNVKFKSYYDTDIIAALNEIKNDINFMSEVLEGGEDGLVLSQFPLSLLSLAGINALINNTTHHGFKFKLDRQVLKSEQMKERGIEANTTLFRTLLNNLLTNADKHGYNRRDPANAVVIELNEIEDKLILEVKNNGKAFPFNMDKEKFISKFTSANPADGRGLGGYDINRIAKYFGNDDWELIINDDPIYPVKFKFQFPIKILK
jgi:type I restriction enzyme M protein